MRRGCPCHTTLLRWALLVAVVPSAALAQGQAQPSAAAAAQAEYKNPYPPEPGNLPRDPGDIDLDLDTPPALPGAIFPELRLPGWDRYEKFKEDLYRHYGIRFAGFYAQLYQSASDTLPGAPFDAANGGWGALQFSWTALNRGTDYEGSLVMNLGWRNSIGRNAVPAGFGVPMLGAAWSNYEFTSWACPMNPDPIVIAGHPILRL